MKSHMIHPVGNPQSGCGKGDLVAQVKSHNKQKSFMAKRRCKDVDIADENFILNSIIRCMSNKPLKSWKRSDVKRIFNNKTFEDVAHEMSYKIKNRLPLDLPPVHEKQKIDSSTGKLRVLSIEDIQQQFYDYVAYDGLNDLARCIGKYQFGVQKGTGCQRGAKTIQSWLNRYPDIRYGVKADIQKCYPSITHKNMMKWLTKRVKNDSLLWLIQQLLDSVSEGLPIGSYLSIRLAGMYLSDLYYYITQTFFKYRRNKKINMVIRAMFYLDDIYIFGSSARDLRAVIISTEGKAREYGLIIKGSWVIIDLNPLNKDAHFDAMGYRIYRDRITMRNRNYRRTKHALRVYKGVPTIHNAMSYISYYGLNVHHTNSHRFKQKYNADYYYMKARKAVSVHAKSNFRQETTTNYLNYC